MSESPEGPPRWGEAAASALVPRPDAPLAAPGGASGARAPLVLAGDLGAQVRAIQDLTAIRPATAARRALFLWLRVFVIGVKPNGKRERVNVRLPIPLPLVGLLLPWRISRQRALATLAAAQEAPDGLAALQRALDSAVAFEFVRVEEHNPATGKSELVVVGLE